MFLNGTELADLDGFRGKDSLLPFAFGCFDTSVLAARLASMSGNCCNRSPHESPHHDMLFWEKKTQVSHQKAPEVVLSSGRGHGFF